MGSRRELQREAALRLWGFVKLLFEEGKKNSNKGPFIFEMDTQGYLLDEGCTNPLENFWNRTGVMVVLEKAVSCVQTEEPEEQKTDVCLSEDSSKECPVLRGLSISRARQLISFYTMSQNPDMGDVKTSNSVQPPPLWVRCDGTDPQQTIWLGAEPHSAGNDITGMTLHTVISNGPLSNKNCSADLEELKESHRRRHHCHGLRMKGFASYKFLGDILLDSYSLEDTSSPPERNIYVDFAWNDVTEILQTPPPNSVVTLKLQMACGSPLSSVYEVGRELQFLLGLAKSLRTGVKEWRKPSEGKSAVELVQKLLKRLKDGADEVMAPGNNETENLQNDTAAVSCSMKTVYSSREELDFVEQLWCKLWKSVTSYEELVKCFKLILECVHCGELQLSIHEGSNGLLPKLIIEYHRGSMTPVSLSGDTPIQMFLEIGLEKMKRDYVSYFIDKRLALRSHLDYFMSTSVDLQEQVHRIQKLHRVLEIVTNCVDLLKLDHFDLIFLIQSCLKYYQENPLNEMHMLEIPVKQSSVTGLCQNADLKMWKVEISSGQRQKVVKTTWQFSTDPPAEHLSTRITGLLDSTEVCNNLEGACFSTLAECSQVHFSLR
ncbi:protein zwilch homolog [Heteronotia binoei]|uniref:protein zwilch homolog n=1 Tax=Heteronotia binoei TaxID=13085 RepID=UPI00292EA2D9|nr:protein zwilch homolog [Heteronotia binoei]